MRASLIRVTMDTTGSTPGHERDVLQQIALGLSNAEIAEALCITEATTTTHNTRVLAKLELRDRVYTVVFAYSTGSSCRRTAYESGTSSRSKPKDCWS